MIETTCAKCGVKLRLGTNALHPPAQDGERFYCQECGGHSDKAFTADDVLAIVASLPREQQDALKAALTANFQAPRYPYQVGCADSLALARAALVSAEAAYERLPRDLVGVHSYEGPLNVALGLMEDAKEELERAIALATCQTVENGAVVNA